jgi:hypothetical protein
MNRQVWMAAVAVGAMTLTAVASGPADAGSNEPAAAKPATSLAAIGLDGNKVEYIDSLSNGSPKVLRVVSTKYADGIYGTAIGASGATSLIAEDTGAAVPVTKVRTTPAAASQLNLNQFRGEGGSAYNFYSEGVAIIKSSALVASDEAGVVQLILRAGHWRVDTRVNFGGKNDSGFPRARGFIPFPKENEISDYNAVVISPTALPNGKYLAIAVDRENDTIAIIEGVGTPKPKVAVFTNTAFGDSTQATDGPDAGTGGAAFSPATPYRAVVTTPTGLAVLNLTNPMKPKLQSKTTVGVAGEADSIAVSADGDHVAEAVGDTVYTFTGLLTTAAGPLPPVTTIKTGDTDGSIFDVAYLANNSLAVSHGDAGDGYHLTMYSGATSGSPTQRGSVALGDGPGESNTLSVWPSSVPPNLGPAHLLRGAKVGKAVKQRLSVAGGVGIYSYKVTAGKLPTGLRLHGAFILGTPKRAGKVHFTVIATNQYGGSVVAGYVVKVAAG